MELHRPRLEGQRVLVFPVLVVDTDYNQPLPARALPRRKDRQFLIVFQRQVARIPLVPECRQQLPEPPPLQLDTLSVIALRSELVAESKVLVLQPAQGGIRRPARLFALFRVLPPLPARLLQVLVKDLRQIVVAVELLFVPDADKGARSLSSGHLVRLPGHHAHHLQPRLVFQDHRVLDPPEVLAE